MSTIQSGLLILQGQRYATFLSACARKNSRTSRKRPAKLPRLSGRLREYNQRGSPPGTGLTHLHIRREFIAYTFVVTVGAVLGCH